MGTLCACLMKAKAALPMISLCILFISLGSVQSAASHAGYGEQSHPEPPVWPQTFHAVTAQNRTGRLALVDLYYEWPKGRNANLIHSQLGTTLYDIEYTNHTSYYFNREEGTCKEMIFPVGILTPDWLVNATYLGKETVDAHETNVWTKSDGFIKYYADIESGLPVRWIFFDGAQFEILSFIVNETLPDAEWQAPSYCFQEATSHVMRS